MTSWVVAGLREKRSEVAGRIVAMERDLGQMRADLLHIDAVLRLYGDEAPETLPPKRSVAHSGWFRVGECARLAMDTLRRSDGGPLTTRQITEALMVAKGLEPGDVRTRELVQRAVLGTLYRMKGLVERSGGGGPGRDVTWRLLPQ